MGWTVKLSLVAWRHQCRGHGASWKAECPSRKLIDKFQFVGIKAVPFGEGGGEAVGRGSDLHRSVYLILSVGQSVLFCYNFFYLSTFALMQRGHLLSDKRVRK